MKTFIALELSNDIKNLLADIQFILSKHSLKGNFVNVNNFHITLKYLGDTSLVQCENIKEALEKTCYNMPIIKLYFDKLDFFEGNNILRVVWIGLKGDINKLHEFKNAVEDDLCKIGFKKENRKYHPHITIGRNIEFDKTIKDLNNIIYSKLQKTLSLDTVTLMKSESIDGKRVYTPINSFKLT